MIKTYLIWNWWWRWWWSLFLLLELSIINIFIIIFIDYLKSKRIVCLWLIIKFICVIIKIVGRKYSFWKDMQKLVQVWSRWFLLPSYKPSSKQPYFIEDGALKTMLSKILNKEHRKAELLSTNNSRSFSEAKTGVEILKMVVT